MVNSKEKLWTVQSNPQLLFVHRCCLTQASSYDVVRSCLTVDQLLSVQTICSISGARPIGEQLLGLLDRENIFGFEAQRIIFNFLLNLAVDNRG